MPPAPEVSLAQIQSNSVTVEWTRPNRPVQKYIIQVNGKTVGSQGPQDSPAIAVTGLKPGYFYNIRVIAVGSTNFQVGSPVLRLRTLASDSKPQLGNGRSPPHFVDPNQARLREDGDNESNISKSLLPSIEAAKTVDGATGRDAGLGGLSQRRNIANRRHSPSVASQEAPVVKDREKEATSSESQESLAKLNEIFQQIRTSIAETISQYEKDEADFKAEEAKTLEKLETKRQEQREKKGTSDGLRSEKTSADIAARRLEGQRKQLLTKLEEKKGKIETSQRRLAKLEDEVRTWKEKRGDFLRQKEDLDKARAEKVAALEKEITTIQSETVRLEAILNEKKQTSKELKNERKKLPGGEADEQWEQTDLRLKKEWDTRRRELEQRMDSEEKRRQNLLERIRHHQAYLNQVQHLVNAGSASNEFDPSAQAHLRHHSRQSGSVSMWGAAATYGGTPDALYGTTMAPNVSSGLGFGSPGAFMSVPASAGEAFDHSHAPSAAPLSPSATSLVPRGILGDDLDDTPSPSSGRSPFRPAPAAEDAQSPTSSSRSLSLLSSPRSSSQHLPYPSQFTGERSDPRSRELGIGSPPNAVSASASASAQPSRFGFLNSWHKRGGLSKDGDELGPALGTLKAGQSQSFPRQADDGDGPGGRRRIGFGTGLFNRNSVHADTGDIRGITAGGTRTRRLNLFASSTPGIPGMGDGDPSSPRPSSLASSDLARPSTDSGSMWAQSGDAPLGQNRLHVWPPSDGRWPSRTHSRRTSLHGQSMAPATTLASTDDEILDDEDLLNPQASPSQVGVIGSRIPNSTSRSLSHRLNPQRLNPKAPAFMGSLFRKQDRDGNKEKPETKAKAKDRTKSKGKAVGGSATPSLDASQPTLDDSPSDSRKSRDTFSVHTQTSVSESRESLNLDTSLSHTASDSNIGASPAGGSAANLKDQEVGLKKLFRKGSSSRFSLRLNKKGPGSSTANSDKNFSADRSSVGDVDDIGDDTKPTNTGGYDSVTSSPLLGPAKVKDKEGRMSSWRFAKKKKGPKESLELDRDRNPTQESET